MKLDKENLVFYKDKDGNTEFRLANITAFFAEGMKFLQRRNDPAVLSVYPCLPEIKGQS